MTYDRPVSSCQSSASDLAGEVVAALAAASLVFNQEKQGYSERLVQAAESLFEHAKQAKSKGTYIADKACAGETGGFYNSTTYLDELAWGGTWLFFATGNYSHLQDATDTFQLAMEEESVSDNGIFYWNNKVAANAVLFTRLRYLHDPGYPYEETLKKSSDMADKIMCSYLSSLHNRVSMTPGSTPGGLILLGSNSSAPLQYATTAAFLSKLYNDYLSIIQVHGGSCNDNSFSLQMLQSFATSQVNYILGNNPMKMSYLVGFGDHFPQQVHHRGASIPLDGHSYSCSEGERWRESKDPNPNILVGAMVGGPGEDDRFLDQRDQPKYTEPTISNNAGLVAALIALLDYPNPTGMNIISRGMDPDGIFTIIS